MLVHVWQGSRACWELVERNLLTLWLTGSRVKEEGRWSQAPLRGCPPALTSAHCLLQPGLQHWGWGAHAPLGNAWESNSHGHLSIGGQGQRAALREEAGVAPLLQPGLENNQELEAQVLL